MSVRRPRFPQPFAAIVLAAALVYAAPAASQRSVLPTLYVNYAMNCTFKITSDSGAAVTSIAPGDYQVLVTTPVPFAAPDLTGLNDFTACRGSVMFQLTGPGVNVSTTLDDGDGAYSLYNATFRASSTYVAQDNNQPTVARATFTTLAGGTPITPTASYGAGTAKAAASSKSKTAPKQASPMRGALAAAVTAAGSPKLTFNGKTVSSLRAGRYTVSVVDASRTSGFILQASRKSALTVAGIAFTGKRTLTVDLEAGQWFFYPTFVGKKSHFVVTG